MYEVSIQVESASLQPITTAVVSVNGQSFSVDGSGRTGFVISLPGGTYTFTASAPYYVSSSIQLGLASLSATQISALILLQPATALSSSISDSTSTTTKTSLVTTSNPRFDFALSPSSSYGELIPGGKLAFSISIEDIAGTAEPVTFHGAGVPEGVSLSFAADPFSSGLATTTNIEASPSAKPGSYAISISGVSPSAQRAFIFLLVVRPLNYGIVVESVPSIGGSTTPSSGTYTVPTNSTLSVAEKPADGWAFREWLLNGVGAGNASSILVRATSNTLVIALFEPADQPHQTQTTYYRITISALGVGTAQIDVDGRKYQLPASFSWPSGSAHVVSASREISLTNSGQATLVGWTGSLGSSKNIVSFTINGTTSLTANYLARYPVQLRFEDQAGGSIYPENVTLASARGLVLVPPSGLVWLANATYSLLSVNWRGAELIGTGNYPQVDVNGPVQTTIKLQIYNMQIHLQDIFGNPLSGAAVSLQLPDGTTMTDITGTDGVARFARVPQGTLSLSTQYLGVSTQFSVDAAEAQSPSITVALSYPVYALIGVFAGTIAIVFLKLRRRTSSTPWAD